MPEVKLLPLWKNMLGVVAFLKGEEKTTDISFQISTPLNNQQEGGSYSSKAKSFHGDKQGSQSYFPTLKKWKCLHCCQSSVR